MELELLSEHYIKKDSVSEAIYKVLKEFAIKNKDYLFADEFVFDEEMMEYISGDLKNTMTFAITDDGYFKIKEYVFTFQKINKILIKVLVLKDAS